MTRSIPGLCHRAMAFASAASFRAFRPTRFAVCFFVVVVQKFAARARDRHPGGEILSLYDWLIDTRSYSDWLVVYEAGKVARPIRLPPRDERGLSIGRK